MQALYFVVFVSVAVWQVVVARRAAASGGSPRSATPAGFAMWALAGLLATAAMLTALSVGLFIMPLAVAALWIAGRFSPETPGICGVVTGAGVFLAIVALIAFVSDSASGPDPLTWSLVGILLILAGGAGFVLLRGRAGTVGEN